MKRVAMLLVLLALCSFPATVGESFNSQHSIIRIHVLAHDDSPEEQAVKLLVRDAVTELVSPWLAGVTEYSAAAGVITESLGTIKAAAEGVVESLGRGHNIALQWGDFVFPTRHYGRLEYPSGVYRSLNVVIGEGQGKNWWCVMYPPLCYVDAVVQDNPSTGDITFQFFFLNFIRQIWHRMKG